MVETGSRYTRIARSIIADYFGKCTISDSAIRISEVSKGDVLHDDECVIVVLRGKLSVFNTALDGSKVLVFMLSGGSCFGAVNLFNRESLRPEMIAETRSVVAFARKDDVIRDLRSDIDLMARYAAFCNERIGFLFERISRLTMSSTRSRLVSYLLSFHSETVTIGFTKEMLASYLCVSRASLFREFSLLEEEGLIESVRNNVYRLDVSRLEDIR